MPDPDEQNPNAGAGEQEKSPLADSLDPANGDDKDAFADLKDDLNAKAKEADSAEIKTESAESWEYEFKTPEGVKEPPKEFAEFLKNIFKENKVSPEQGKNLYAKYLEFDKKFGTERRVAAEKACEQQLKEIWKGDEYNTNLVNSRRALRAYTQGDEAKIKEVQELLNSTNVLQSPTFSKIIAFFGSRSAEAELKGEKIADGFAMTPERARQKIQELRLDNNFQKALHNTSSLDEDGAKQHENAKKLFANLYNIAHSNTK